MTTHTTPTSGAADLPEALHIDRGEAVNLARNITVEDGIVVTQKGVRILADAVLLLDAALTAQAITPPHVKKPEEIKHVAADVSKTWAESNMTQAISAEPAGGDAVAVVKRYIGGVVVHIVGDVKEGDLLYLRPTAPSADSVLEDAARYRWLRDESWAGYNSGNGTPKVYTIDGAGNRKMQLAEDAMDSAVDAARAAQKEASNG